MRVDTRVSRVYRDGERSIMAETWMVKACVTRLSDKIGSWVELRSVIANPGVILIGRVAGEVDVAVESDG